VEINMAAGEWIGQAGRVLERGVATIIDYGDTSPNRYSEARKEGTLLGYQGGAVTDNILARPGRQDLTALVDFTALQDAAVQAGFDVLAITRQANFLLGLGLGTTLTAESMGGDLARVLANRRGLQALVSPEGLGRFHVLLLGRGMEPGAARAGLSGLRYAEI
jgi:SAM-dependent MidA family methyltransferase